MYIMAGKFAQRTGSRAMVWHKTAKKTTGGLEKKDLFKTRSGRIVSRSKHFSAKKNNNLVKHGYGTKKGVFGFVRTKTRKNKRGPGRPRKSKGGSLALSPARATANYMLGK